jgi:hypothetical protein
MLFRQHQPLEGLNVERVDIGKCLRSYRRSVTSRYHASRMLIPATSWERCQENLKILESGRAYELASASPPREGAALLQGRAICGRKALPRPICHATRQAGRRSIVGRNMGSLERISITTTWQLYQPPGPNKPAKHCSRWDRLVDRAAGLQAGPSR